MLPKISPVDDNDCDDHFDDFHRARTIEDPWLSKISPGNDDDDDN